MLALVLSAALALTGCVSLSDMFGLGDQSQEETLTNGTTTGNILNGGFAVKDGDDLLVCYTGGDVYPKGSLVRSNPETGASSLVLDKAAKYMNLADGMLYGCLDDGIYRTALNAPAWEKVQEGSCSLLQIYGDRMYYINDGTVDCAALDGSAVAFTPVENAACLNVYKDKLYYIDTARSQIWQADTDGTDCSLLYDKIADMFYIIDDVIYFIDGADGLLKRMSLKLDTDSIETLTEKPCSGFNVNRQGLYYTLKEDGLCYNAGADGLQAQTLGDFAKSAWHRVCIFGDGALVVRQEDIPS